MNINFNVFLLTLKKTVASKKHCYTCDSYFYRIALHSDLLRIIVLVGSLADLSSLGLRSAAPGLGLTHCSPWAKSGWSWVLRIELYWYMATPTCYHQLWLAPCSRGGME